MTITLQMKMDLPKEGITYRHKAYRLSIERVVVPIAAHPKDSV